MIGKQRSSRGSSSNQKPQPSLSVKEAMQVPPPKPSVGARYMCRTLSPSLTPLQHPLPPSSPSRPIPQPQQSNQDLILRLRKLLDSVISILNALPPNPRTHSLHIFYNRIIDLLNSPAPLEEQMVDSMEREWWGSEVVAAWYGPTRALRERGLGGGEGSAGFAVKVKADMMYVGLHDE